MTRLFHCNTHYNTKPPTDINPLILERYKRSKILVFCARKGMLKRISKMISDLKYPYPDQKIMSCGWWETDLFEITKGGEVDLIKLLAYDVIIIVGRERIDKSFLPIVESIEKLFICSQPDP